MWHLVVVAEDPALAQLAEKAFQVVGIEVASSASTNEPMVRGVSVSLASVPPNLTTQEAAHWSAQIGRTLKRQTAALNLFVLIDSELCGPIDPLTGGLIDVLNRSALVCPADPAHGRTIHGGRLYRDGFLVSDRPSLLGELLGEYATPGHVSAVSARAARQGGDALRFEVEQRFHVGASVVIVDADTLECLTNVARLWCNEKAPDILVGSQALLYEVRRRLARL
jgi:uncharacterized protein YgbK (DUF1537 family)